MKQSRGLVLFYAVLVSCGGVLLALPEGLTRTRLDALALRYSPDGIVSPAGQLLVLKTYLLIAGCCVSFGAAGLGLLAAAAYAPLQQGEPPARPAPPRKVEAGALLALTLCSLALRVPRLGSALDYDEAFTALHFVDPAAPWRAFTSFVTLNNHPLSSALEAVAVSALGGTEAALRLPSFVAGVLLPAAVFLLVRRAGVWPGAVAAALVAVDPLAVAYSAQARGYALLMLCTVASTLLLWRAVEQPRTRRWAAYVALSAVGCWVHLSMALVVAGHIVALAGAVLAGRATTAVREVLPRLPAAILVPALAAYALVLPRVPLELANFALSERAPMPDWDGAAHAASVLVGFLGGTWMTAGEAWVLSLTAWGAAALSFWCARRDVRFVALVGPLALGPLALAVFGRQFPGAERFFVGLGPLLLGAAAPAVRLRGWRGPLALLLLVGTASIELRALARHYAAPESGLRRLGAIVRALPPDVAVGADWSVRDALPFYVPQRRLSAGAPRAGVYVCRVDCASSGGGPGKRSGGGATRELARVDEPPVPYRVLLIQPAARAAGQP